MFPEPINSLLSELALLATVAGFGPHQNFHAVGGWAVRFSFCSLHFFLFSELLFKESGAGKGKRDPWHCQTYWWGEQVERIWEWKRGDAGSPLM